MNVNNITTISKRFLQKHELAHHKKLLDIFLHFHSQAFSMKAISDTLRYHGIFTMVVSINEDQLHQIPLPAVVHCNNGSEGVFRCLTKVDQESVVYYEEARKETQPLDDFINEWTGISLLGEKTESTFYKSEKSISSISIRWIFIIMILFAFLGIIMTLHTLSINSIIQAVLLLLGALAGVITIFKSHGIENGITSYLCDAAKWNKLDCNAVLQSDARFLGLSLGVMATTYFLSGLLFFVFITGIDIFLLAGAIGIPLVVYLLYRQFFVIKKVCSLCLIIAFIYLTYNTISWMILDGWSFKMYENAYPSILIFIMAFMVSVLLDQFLLSQSEKQKSANELFRWKTNEEIFNIQLRNNPKVVFPDELSPIIIHPEATDQVVTLIISLNCDHCLRALHDLKTLISVSPETRFEILIHQGKNEKENDNIEKLMKLSGRDAIEKIMEYFIHRQDLKDIGGIISSPYLPAYLNWKKTHKNYFFPQIYFNQSLVPSQYRIRDLLYFTS